MSRVHQFSSVMPPVMGSVLGLAHSTTAARYEVPWDWTNEIVTFYSDTSTLCVGFGDAGVMVDQGKLAATVSETIVAHWGTGIIIPAGSYVNVYCPKGATHFSVDSSAASGNWYAYRSSGAYLPQGEPLPVTCDDPSLWLDAGLKASITGTTTVSVWRGKSNGFRFTEGTNYPDYTAPASAAALPRPTIKFTAASSDKLTCTDAGLTGLVGGTSAFTLAIAWSRAATGAAHTLFSVGTTGSANGRWDVSVNASDDLIVTRVTSGGSSTTSTGTIAASTTVTAAKHLLVYTFDGTTSTVYHDRVDAAVSGNAAGDVGTVSRVGIGCRTYNTSTHDQFLGGEISEVMLYPRALGTAAVSDLHNWLKRRYGV